MGQYNKAIITAAGESLIARAIIGEIQLDISRAKTSDHEYPGSTDFKALTDMQGIKQVMDSPETKVLETDLIQTRVLFSNEDIQSTYYIQNIGLYAMDGTQEVLFCILTAEMPDEMPQYNGVASTSYIYNIQNVVQEASEINIMVNPSGTATIQDVLERVDATGGDISETVIETLDTVEEKYPVPAAGETMKVFAGKVKKFIEDSHLAADLELYVSVSTGSDTTGDGSDLNPYASITKALDTISKNLNGFVPKVYISGGIYLESINIANYTNGHLEIYLSGDVTITDLTINNSYVIWQGQDSTHTLTTGYIQIIDNAKCSMYASVNILVGGFISNAGENISILAIQYSEIYLSGLVSLQGNTGTAIRAINHAKVYLGTIRGSGFLYGFNTFGGSRIDYAICQLSAIQPYATNNGGLIVKASGAVIGTLLQDIYIYASTTGSDLTGNGTSANPYRHIQFAIDSLPRDLGGYSATAYVMDGTYDEDIVIPGFHNGVLNIRSYSSADTLNTVCNILNARILFCTARVQLFGLNLTSTSYHGVEVNGCTDAYMTACQASGSASGYQSFRFIHSIAKLWVCRGDNHDTCLYAYNSKITSMSWTNSSGITYGTLAEQGSIISKDSGSQPTGGVANERSNMGMFVNSNGTQISGLITSGLSCTWGTIQGGYVRHGNLNGVAMVTLEFRVILTTAISVGNTYTIAGFPTASGIGSANIAVTCSVLANGCYLDVGDGGVRFQPASNMSVGQSFVFNATYLANS